MAELPKDLQDLVRLYARAANIGRKARCAELQGRAIGLAKQAYGADSLVVAHLLVERAHTLRAEWNIALESEDLDASIRLITEAWQSARSALPTLERLRRDGTLLPGCCKPEEVALRRLELASCTVSAPAPAELVAIACEAVGVTSYWTAAMSAELVVLVVPALDAAGIRVAPELLTDFELANRFLLSALDLVAEVRHTLYPQAAVVELCNDLDANLEGMSINTCPPRLRPLFRKRAEPAVAEAFARVADPGGFATGRRNAGLRGSRGECGPEKARPECLRLLRRG